MTTPVAARFWCRVPLCLEVSRTGEQLLSRPETVLAIRDARVLGGRHFYELPTTGPPNAILNAFSVSIFEGTERELNAD
jgi:hypothetical protein